MLRTIAGMAALPALASFADNYPSRAVRLVVPFTPGGSSDVLARAISGELARDIGQPVVIDNIAGAGGSVGAERVAKAQADGYTLLMGHIGTLAVNPWLYPKLGYDPLRSFTPVAWIARVPNVLVVHPSVPARTLAELVQYAKSHPGKLAYGSGGNGSAAHLATEYLKMQAGISMLHIPYRGTAPAVTDLIAGQVQVLFTGTPALLPQIRAGRMRALAVSSRERIASLPDVPTVAETGVAGTKGFEADQWYGIVAPAGTPADAIALLNRNVNRELESNEVRARLASEGAQPSPATPQAFGHLIESELTRWEKVIGAAHIRAE